MNRRVLFVEDEALLRTIYHRQTHGRFEVDIVSGAAEALAAVAEHSYAVIVTDLSMPGMDGLELALAIRSRDERAVLMLLTADIEPQAGTPGADLMFRVLVKPCPREVLIASLESALALYNEGFGDPPLGPPDLWLSQVSPDPLPAK